MPTYKIVTKPEGQPTFEDPNSGAVREYLRVTELAAENEKLATKHVEAQMWDIHVATGEPVYEVVSVEVIGE